MRPEKQELHGKPFTDVLGEIRNGDLLVELTSEVYKVMRAVMETRKAGGIKLAVTITPTGKGFVTVTAAWDSKIPEHDKEATTFFVSEDYSLHRDDPRQERLPLRAVETDTDKPIRRVD